MPELSKVNWPCHAPLFHWAARMAALEEYLTIHSLTGKVGNLGVCGVLDCFYS